MILERERDKVGLNFSGDFLQRDRSFISLTIQFCEEDTHPITNPLTHSELRGGMLFLSH